MILSGAYERWGRASYLATFYDELGIFQWATLSTRISCIPLPLRSAKRHSVMMRGYQSHMAILLFLLATPLYFRDVYEVDIDT